MSFIDKEYLRKKFKLIKNGMSHNTKHILNKKIEMNISSLDEYLNSTVILAYMANNLEVNLDNIICEAIKSGKKVAIPKCNDFDSESNMDFYFLDSLDNINIGKYGIREPSNIKNNFIIENCIQLDNIIVFLPGLVFDNYGYRVGYGKGYYDRYLSKISCNIVKIGICYDIAVVDKINKEENDIPVDILITETKIIRLK